MTRQEQAKIALDSFNYLIKCCEDLGREAQIAEVDDPDLPWVEFVRNLLREEANGTV